MADKILRSRATKAAAKRLPFMPETKQEARLEMACMSLAEAYRCGAEEAQNEIVQRLIAIPAVGKT